MPTTALTQAGEWTDSQAPAVSARLGVAAPTFTAVVGGVYALRFATGDEVHGSIQLPHSVTGTELRMHVHFTFAAATTAAQTVIWGLEYSIAPINGTFPATGTQTGTYILDGTENLKHCVQGIFAVPLPASPVSAIILFRAYRAGGTSAVPPFLLSVDGHFQQGNYGTETDF